jgi:catechol 2,3-dioxygenase-like lactoylglutathione lyase family enzyme
MPLTSLNHVTVRTDQLEKTRDFYRDALGLEVGWRPDLAFPGYWLYCGDTAVVHLVPPSDAIGGGPSADTGHFDHVAFLAEDFPGVKARLERMGVRFEERYIASAKIRQLFFPDINNVMIEVNFPNQA